MSGSISQIIGAVIDVEFEPAHLPELYSALRIEEDDGVEEETSLAAPRARLDAGERPRASRRGRRRR